MTTSTERLREAATVAILEPKLSAWLEEAADASIDPRHDVPEPSEYDDPDDGPQCCINCGTCLAEAVALAVADQILGTTTP